MRDPASLEDMTALRAEIDATDRELSALMAHRARLIARAAELKAGNGEKVLEAAVAALGRNKVEELLKSTP